VKSFYHEELVKINKREKAKQTVEEKLRKKLEESEKVAKAVILPEVKKETV